MDKFIYFFTFSIILCLLFFKNPYYFSQKYPQEFYIDKFHLKKIDTKYYKEDYIALMSSKDYIRKILGEKWPEDSLTEIDNLNSINKDIESFNKKNNYTYSIFYKDKIIGSFYISKNEETLNINDHIIFVWMTPEHIENGNLNIFIQNSKKFLNNINKNYIYINEISI